MKKSNSRWGGVAECIFDVPTLHGDHKKNDPHAAWEGRNRELRHLSSENVDFCRSSDFCCCGFWSIWGRQIGIPAGSLKENVKMIKNI